MGADLRTTLAKIRGARGLSQDDLAALTGIRRTDISKIENGLPVGAKRLRLLADALEVSALELAPAAEPDERARLLEHRLEELAANDAEILANQKRAVGEILREVRALAATLERLLEDGRTAPKRRFQ